MRHLVDLVRLANPVVWFAAALSSLVTSALLLAGVPSWLLRGVAAGLLVTAYGASLQGRRRARREAAQDPRRRHGPGYCLDGENCPLK